MLHPITIWRYLSKFSFLLILPLTQAVLQEPFSTVAWSSLPMVLSAAVLSYYEYYSCRARTEQHSIRYCHGIFIQHQKLVPFAALASISIRITPLLRLFGAAQLFLDTPAGSRSKADLQLTLRRSALLGWWHRAQQDVSARYRAKPARILLMAASWSNPAAGLLFAAIALNKASRILGEQLSDELYGTVNQSHRLVALGIPPAVALVGWLLVLGWLVAFLRQAFRYAGFTAAVSPQGILIFRGLLVRNRQLLTHRALRAVSTRQTLVMAALRLTSAYLHTVGSGKEKGDRSLLLAAVHFKALDKTLRVFYQAFRRPPPCEPIQRVRPSLSALKSFLLVPLLHLCWTGALSWLLWSGDSVFASLAVFPLLFPLYQGIVRVLAWRRSFFAFDGIYLTASGYTGLQLYTAVLPRENLQSVVLRQNPFQRHSGRCTLRLQIGSEKHAIFTVRHLAVEQVRQILKLS